MAYESVNGKWPEGTRDGRDIKPTPQEALRGAKQLYRRAMGKSFGGKWALTSGRRYTYPRNGIFYVNPDQGDGGWHEIVHGISHYVSWVQYRENHGPRHAFIERELIAHVVNAGWLEGKLKRPEKPKPDKKAMRRAKITLAIKRWERKAKLANTKLKKLRAAAKRYAGTGAKVSTVVL